MMSTFGNVEAKYYLPSACSALYFRIAEFAVSIFRSDFCWTIRPKVIRNIKLNHNVQTVYYMSKMS